MEENLDKTDGRRAAREDDPDLRAFASRLTWLLRQRNWSHAYLGRRAGLTPESVASYVKARRWPGAQSAKLMAAAFGLSVADLYGGGKYPRELPMNEGPNLVVLVKDGVSWARIRLDVVVPLSPAIQACQLLSETSGIEPPSREEF